MSFGLCFVRLTMVLPLAASSCVSVCVYVCMSACVPVCLTAYVPAARNACG
jgi:hypothetical protein